MFWLWPPVIVLDVKQTKAKVADLNEIQLNDYFVLFFCSYFLVY